MSKTKDLRTTFSYLKAAFLQKRRKDIIMKPKTQDFF